MEVGAAPSGNAPGSIGLIPCSAARAGAAAGSPVGASVSSSARGEGFGPTTELVHLGEDKRSRELRLSCASRRAGECRTPARSTAPRSGSGDARQTPARQLAGGWTRDGSSSRPVQLAELSSTVPTADERRVLKGARVLQTGNLSRPPEAYGRKWRETKPRGCAGIKPLRGWETLRADGAGEAIQHANDRRS